ncbi:MAG: STAS domain-containing protein [Candidatus Competibacteraceae bacterium]|nr:STAS domain-containing protein [Candidatus Competibacteraceae bacterium]
MTLTISAHTPRADTRQLALHGRLDSTTAPMLDKRLDEELGNRVQTLVIDLAELGYISSAGIQCLLKARKLQAKAGGKLLVLNPQPQINKVFEIIGVIPVKDVFASVEELDAYLDAIQQKVLDGDL